MDHRHLGRDEADVFFETWQVDDQPEADGLYVVRERCVDLGVVLPSPVIARVHCAERAALTALGPRMYRVILGLLPYLRDFDPNSTAGEHAKEALAAVKAFTERKNQLLAAAGKHKPDVGTHPDQGLA